MPKTYYPTPYTYQLLGICLESIVYGVFLVLYAATIWVLSGRRRNDRTAFSYIMMVTVTTMMVLATTVSSVQKLA